MVNKISFLKKLKQKMKNKKGYIRTLEAIIAIVIIFIFILSILPQREKEEAVPKNIDITAEQILSEIQNNNEYREYVYGINVGGNCDNYCKLKKPINENIPITIGFELMVCYENGCYFCPSENEECGSELVSKEPSQILNEKKSIYTKNVVITKNDQERIIKLFLWRKA